MTARTENLATMVAQLLDGWADEVDYAVLAVEHDSACHGRMLAATLGQLRHWECECPAAPRRVREMRHRDPLLLELTESSFSKPVIASDGGSGAKLHPPLPGDLENYDTVIRILESAAWTICADWYLDTTPNDGMIRHLECIRLEIGARLANERDDAAAVLRPGWQAARLHLGYERRPLRLVCECGGSMALEALELACDGCTRRHGVSAELAAVMVAEVMRARCKRQHDPDWRLNAQGNPVCRTCSDLLASRRAARKAKDKERSTGRQLDRVLQ